jgi:hypothetical protein
VDQRRISEQADVPLSRLVFTTALSLTGLAALAWAPVIKDQQIGLGKRAEQTPEVVSGSMMWSRVG